MVRLLMWVSRILNAGGGVADSLGRTLRRLGDVAYEAGRRRRQKLNLLRGGRA